MSVCGHVKPLYKQLVIEIHLGMFVVSSMLIGALSPQHSPGLANISEGTLPKFSIHLNKILSRAYGSFEEQNKILGSSINY